MPIVKYTPTAVPAPAPELPKISSDSFKGTVVDDKYRAIHSLTAHIQGYPMTVDYYGQILGAHNDPREVDPAQAGTYQQYTRINGFDIRVTEPLDLSYDEDNTLSTITGSAYIYPDVIPNTYDYFLIKTTRGKSALFRIINVIRKSMNRDTLHEVTYVMVGYIDVAGTGKEHYDALQKKVTNEYYFHGDRLAEGKTPLLRPQEHQHIENLFVDYRRVIEYYVSTFFHLTSQTLILPGQSTAIFDRFLVDFLLKICQVNDHPLIVKIRQMNLEKDRFGEQPQIWKAIVERNPIYVAQANKYMGVVGRSQFLLDHWVVGNRYLPMDQYIYPTEGDNSVEIPTDPSIKNTDDIIQDTTGPNGSFYSQGTNVFLSATGNVDIYKRVLVDNYYVLSSEFYSKGNNQCLLEKVLWDYLDNKALQLDEVAALTRQYYSLNRLEQFYYGPIVLLLVRDAQAGQYS